MSSFIQDLKFALRDLRKGALVTALAVFSLAVAIAGNATVFGLINAFLFRPLPYPEPERIVVLGEREATTPTTLTASEANFVDWRERNRSFGDLAGFRPRPMSLGAGERPEPVLAAQVTPGFFEMLGAEPVRGRTFTSGEGLDSNRRVVMLTHRFWRERYAQNEDAVGEALVLNRQPYTIVGVVPDSFEFFDPRVDLWVAMPLPSGALSRERRDVIVVGRLLSGVTMEQAKADMEEVQAALARDYPEANRGFIVDALNFRYEIPDENGRTFFALLQGALVFVLLIACVNIANLLLARQQARRREIALRTALGAGRWRIVRQLLSESLFISGAGGLLGLGLGALGLHMAASSFAGVLPRHWTPSFDGRVVGVTLGLTALAGILFGVSPALMSFRLHIAQVVKEGGRGSAGASRRFFSRALVVAEIALSIILLGGGSVLVETFVDLRHADPGFDPDRLLTVTSSLPDTDDAERVRLTEQLVERASSVAGVERVTAASSLPQNFFVSTSSFVVDAQPTGPDELTPRAVVIMADGHYLDTLKFTLLRGRFIDERDREDASPVAVVSLSLANRYWPSADALGRRLTVDGTSREIVGVVEDVRQSMLQQGSSSFQGAIYVPIAQRATPAPFLLVRTRVAPEAVVGTLRNELSALDQRLAIGQIQTMQEFVDQFFVGANMFNAILSGFGVMALMLAALGTYGVLAYSVSQRSQELGVRMAMGASPSRILTMITRQGAGLALLGLAIGAPFVYMLTRVINGILVYSPPVNPFTVAAVFVVLFAATVLASFVPARRAAALDPVIVLRSE